MINSKTIAYPFTPGDLQLKVAYTGNYPLYIGRARPGALSSAAEWQICKITYDSNNNVTAVQWAAGTNDYSNVWDDRAAASYS
jgi:hypothetical protein